MYNLHRSIFNLNSFFASKTNAIKLQLNIKNNFKTKASTANGSNALPNQSQSDGFTRLLKKTAFTVLFGGACFSSCAIVAYENRQKAINEMSSTKFLDYRSKMNNYWSGLSKTQKVAHGIIAVNCLVWLLFRVPNVRPMLTKYFLLNSQSNINSQLLLSTFAHIEFIHLGMNMLALYLFSSPLHNIFGAEQFTAFYLTSGVFASLASCFAKTLTGRIGLSVGASGALYACFTSIAIAFPNAKFRVLFLPYDINAENMMKGILIFDAVGLLLGWKMFDHAAHLGGALFGIWYVKYGHQYLWGSQRKVIEKWKKFRT